MCVTVSEFVLEGEIEEFKIVFRNWVEGKWWEESLMFLFLNTQVCRLPKSLEEMGGAIANLLLFSQLLLLLLSCASHPLCTDSRAPFTTKTPLVFCPYNGSSCCDSVEDLRLQKLFQAMNITDPACAFHLKSILCAKCDQFSAELFKIESGTQTVPVLCSVSEVSPQSKGAGHDFCGNVWKSCQITPLLNSPFSFSSHAKAQVPVNSITKLTDFWNSKNDFCKAFGGSSDNGKVCFDGKPVSLRNTGTPDPPNGVCLEKISNGSYLYMVAHPDGSNRVFLSNLQGKIWLATVPEEGSGETLVLDESNPFLDITDIVYDNTQVGLMGMAFHPNFAQNGRFFVSFVCNKLRGPGCSGRCSCNTDVGCDPSKLDSHIGVQPCQYNIVISEFTANGTTSQPSTATRANPLEVRRTFTMGILYGHVHGGQILFGPDGYLYLCLGDGEDGLEAYNFAQNKKSLLGKVLRFDIDKLPSAKEISDLNLWGNYSIPEDNPHSEDKELLPEIWALGFRHPWCCSFDSERPSYFLCPDAGKDHYEEVDIVTKGGNYGWRFYEGTTSTNPFSPLKSSGTDTSMDFVNFIFPVMGYNHSAENTARGSASIAGGYFYRSKTDPCMYGRYLYTDLFGFAIWAGTENPENSGNFTTAKLSFSCAHDSPIQCNSAEGSSPPILGYVFALGIDNRKDIFFLTSNGVLRVARPSCCNYTCSKEKLKTIQTPTLDRSRSRSRFTSTGNGSSDLQKELLLLISLFLLLLQDLLTL